MKEIRHEGVLIARLFLTTKLDAGLNFLSPPDELLQVAIWNHATGTRLAAHVHNAIDRKTIGTSEIVFVTSGEVHLDLYSRDGVLIEECNLKAGDIAICIDGGHGYTIVGENTRVLEIKNGPYYGIEIDKTLIEDNCKIGINSNDV